MLNDHSRLETDVLKYIGQGIAMFDSAHNLVIWNDKYDEILQYPKGFLIQGMPVSDLTDLLANRGDYGDGDPAQLSRERLSIFEFNGSAQTKLIVKNKFVYEVMLQKTDSGGIVMSYTDVTERVKFETEKLQTKQLFESVVENSPVSVHLKDRDGRFLMVNKTFEAWYGLTSEDVIGKQSPDLFPSQFSDGFVDQDQEMLVTGQVVEREMQAMFVDGKIHPVHNVKFPVFGDDGEIKGIGTIATDLTKPKLLEEQLRRAQKMEAVGQLTGGIAHDFNNLLSVMIGNAEMLADKVGEDEDALFSIGAIKNAVARGSSLTSRLLLFSRQKTLSPQATDVNELVHGFEDMLRRSLGEAITLTTICSDDLSQADVDPHQFEDALLNLSINARDAMPHGGSLTIQTANVTFDQNYAEQNDEVTPGNYVEVKITDTGSGMNPDTLEKVFEPFFTTKIPGVGTGLGLSMVYGFIKQSMGHITVQSGLGEGTAISLYLPQTTKNDP
jgi:PAS domain S-box-containing protein